jgi:hypothetical protein
VGCSLEGGEKFPASKRCPRRGPQWFNFVGKTTQAFRGLLIGGGEKFPAIKRGSRRGPQWFNFVGKRIDALRGLLTSKKKRPQTWPTVV